MEIFRMDAKIKKQNQIQATNQAKFVTDQLKNNQAFAVQDIQNFQEREF